MRRTLVLALLVVFAVVLALTPACGDGGSDATDTATAPDTAPDTVADTAGDAVADTAADTGEPPLEAQRAALLAVDETERWTLPGLHAPVQVVRTEAGVPHIYAEDEHDLYLVQGFLIGRDRWFSLDLARRLGAGRLSELLGDAVLAQDISSRGLGTRWIADRLTERLTPHQQEIFQAFTDGLNAYVAAVKDGALPPATELVVAAALVGRSAEDLTEPLELADVIAFAGVIVGQLGFETADVARTRVLQDLAGHFAGDPHETLRQEGLIADLWEPVAPIHPIVSANGYGLDTAPNDGDTGGGAKAARATAIARPAAVPPELLARLDRSLQAFEDHRLAKRGTPFGSNGWAVGRRGTRTGGGILSGDGHLPLTVPALFYQAGLDTRLFAADAGEADGTGAGIRQMGLLFPGVPLLAVGTNGRVAWTQTWQEADVTDWYAEELQLNGDGVPVASRFDGQWRPLERIDETYVIADVPALGSAGRSETWARWTTFDGRWLTAVEGREVAPGDPVDAGETVVTMLGGFVVPKDMNDDGVISAVTFDYTGFDIGDLFGAVEAFGRAGDVSEFRDATRGLVAYAQNIVAADSDGGVFYTGYNALPCRGYLDKDGDRWQDGADPRYILDGTRYGGFRIPLDADRRPDEAPGATDPYACVVPFDVYPQAQDPAQGFVLSANNDTGAISLDGSLSDDAWYLGGPWAPGYRAKTIHDALTAHVADSSADVDSMATLQGDHHSPLGAAYAPVLLEAIRAAKGTATEPGADATEEERRLATLWESDRDAFDELDARLQTWLDRGAVAASGVETFYDSPTADDRDDAVATMIFNAWLRAYIAAVFGDEGLDELFALDPRGKYARGLHAVVFGRGADNPLGLASWNPATEESIFFDDRGTPDVLETSREMALSAAKEALTALRGNPLGAGVGGFGTDDMSAWRWGLRHLLRLQSIVVVYAGDIPAVSLLADQLAINTTVLPLADEVPAGDPRRGIKWFPRPGDIFNVDAAHPTFTGTHYHYAYGPQMRMVIALDGGRVSGRNIVPGGQSGLADSPHFADQAALWLGNRTLPLRYHPWEVAEGAEGREVYAPE